MKRSAPRSIAGVIIALLVATVGQEAREATQSGRGAQLPRSLRLYVMDCGTLPVADPAGFGLKKDEVSTLDRSIPCFLVAHPKGTLAWDVGAIPDDEWTPTGRPVHHSLVLSATLTVELSTTKRLRDQLSEIGYSPGAITYLALSHYHYDHTGNANAFSTATWLARQVERDAMFSQTPPAVTRPATYAALRNSKTQILTDDEHDVFGDGTVVLKLAPGHTPAHQVLYVKLAKTGGVVLSGDLYHYAEQRTLKKFTVFDFDQAQTGRSREAVDAFLRKTGAQLWIQHDLAANTRLKKAPNYYD